MSSSDHRDSSKQSAGPRASADGGHRLLRKLLTGVHGLLVLAALVAVVGASVSYFRAAEKRVPRVVPPTMEDVDWTSAESSEYCLACHKPVGPAMAGLDLQHSHPQNVPLNEAQIKAIADLGTIIGPNNTLICMSCHKLGDPQAKYMLADTLDNGRFCEHCHAGHYARGTPHDMRNSTPDEKNRMGQTVAEGGPCSACHLAHRYAREFEPCDRDPGGRCTTCHEVAGCSDMPAVATLDHPVSKCQECHEPHNPAQGMFLKEPVVTLCVSCHKDFAGDAAAGMHPMGPMERALPAELVEAGVWAGEDAHSLTCVTCHPTHTAAHDRLLSFSPDSNRLCLTCHDDKFGEESAKGMAPHHGQSPILNADQREVVRSWNGRVGPSGELLCLSCHDVHKRNARTAMLRFLPKYGETCGACHPQHDGFVGGTHDLRTNFPMEPNIIGLTPRADGPCSACHLAHGFARTAEPTRSDPSGQCVTCHQRGAIGQAKLAEGFGHPDTGCTDCHNPHEMRNADYLSDTGPKLCAKCHSEETSLLGGPHDCTRAPDAWPEAARESGGPCLSCHVPHGGEREDLFRTHGPQEIGHHDDVCLVCHADAAWGAPTAIAAIHPHDISADQNKVDLALVPKDDAGNMRMGCRTCHNPHGGDKPIHLARVDKNERTEGVCLQCHQQKEYIRLTGHSAESLSRAGFDADSCRPCHAMHASPDGAWGQMLSPRFLEANCPTDGEQPVACVPCVSCHRPDGPAPSRAIATHPEAGMINTMPPDASGYLPLFDKSGHVDPQGMIACRTCHVSHGRLDLLQSVAEQRTLTPAEQSAVRMQLRSFEPPNLCTNCHGEEARARFLFFHDPERRAHPLKPQGG